MAFLPVIIAQSANVADALDKHIGILASAFASKENKMNDTDIKTNRDKIIAWWKFSMYWKFCWQIATAEEIAYIGIEWKA